MTTYLATNPIEKSADGWQSVVEIEKKSKNRKQ